MVAQESLEMVQASTEWFWSHDRPYLLVRSWRLLQKLRFDIVVMMVSTGKLVILGGTKSQQINQRSPVRAHNLI